MLPAASTCLLPAFSLYLSPQSSHYKLKLRLPPPTNNLAQILVKENATWGCCGVEASGGAPEVEVMER